MSIKKFFFSFNLLYIAKCWLTRCNIFSEKNPLTSCTFKLRKWNEKTCNAFFVSSIATRGWISSLFAHFEFNVWLLIFDAQFCNLISEKIGNIYEQAHWIFPLCKKNGFDQTALEENLRMESGESVGIRIRSESEMKEGTKTLIELHGIASISAIESVNMITRAIFHNTSNLPYIYGMSPSSMSNKVKK